jgi:hypothetical protein
MSVIVYRAKKYFDRYGDPCDLVHKIHPDGRVVTTYEDELHTSEVTRWKENNDLYENSVYKSDSEVTYEYYKNGVLHTDDNKPCHKASYTRYEDGYETEVMMWYKYGKLHKTNGPAVVRNYYRDDVYEREYYEDGVKVKDM